MPTPPIYVAVVDDDEELCRSFGRLLRAAGFQPITYASAEALLADTKHPQFDCLVLDIELGGMSGIELAEHLLAKGCSTPFIFITAHEHLNARARAAGAGCRRVLPQDRFWCRRPRRDPQVRECGGRRLELTSYDASKDANIGAETLEEHVMEQKIVLTGIARSKGKAAGEALVNRQRMGWAFNHVGNEDGIVLVPGADIQGKSVIGKVVVYPTVMGSTTGAISLYYKCTQSHHGPAAIICQKVHDIDISGAIAGGIPAIDGLDQDPITTIKTGDWVEIDAPKVGQKATVTITRKE